MDQKAKLRRIFKINYRISKKLEVLAILCLCLQIYFSSTEDIKNNNLHILVKSLLLRGHSFHIHKGLSPD